MAAKGTESKLTVFNKLQEVFPNSFWEDEGKILRIPLDENGARVEIKVTLTAAKTNLGGDSVQSAFDSVPVVNTTSSIKETHSAPLEPTQEEKDNVSKLLSSLGFH